MAVSMLSQNTQDVCSRVLRMYYFPGPIVKPRNMFSAVADLVPGCDLFLEPGRVVSGRIMFGLKHNIYHKIV